MRHGAAVDPSRAATDSQRHLTERGRAESRTAGRLMRKHGLVPTHLYTSPLVRAVQTAEVVAAALGLEGPIPAHPPLVPGGGSERAFGVLDAHVSDDRVLMVSHEPTVRALAGHLAGFDFPGFPTGGVAVFEVGETPRFLGRIDPRVGELRGPEDLS